MVVRVLQIVRFVVQEHFISYNDVRRDDRSWNRTHEVRGSNPLSSTRRNISKMRNKSPANVAGLT